MSGPDGRSAPPGAGTPSRAGSASDAGAQGAHAESAAAPAEPPLDAIRAVAAQAPAAEAGAPASAPPSRREARLGLLIVAMGVMVFTPDALTMRLSELEGITLASLRGLFGGAVLLIGSLILHGRDLPRAMISLGRWGIAMALLEAATLILFTLAIAWTSVANAMLAFAATPMLAAMLAWIFLGERIARQTWLAIAGTAAGLSLVAVSAGSEGALSLKGVAAGFGSALLIATFFVLLRKLRAGSATPMIGAGWLLGGLLALPFASFQGIQLYQVGFAAISGGVITPLAISLIALGSRRLPAAETSMMTLLEVVLGPLLVWAILGENPGAWTLVGGAVVLSALAGHAAWRWRAGEG